MFEEMWLVEILFSFTSTIQLSFLAWILATVFLLLGLVFLFLLQMLFRVLGFIVYSLQSLFYCSSRSFPHYVQCLAPISDIPHVLALLSFESQMSGESGTISFISPHG